jgi:hypothetical protein
MARTKDNSLFYVHAEDLGAVKAVRERLLLMGVDRDRRRADRERQRTPPPTEHFTAFDFLLPHVRGTKTTGEGLCLLVCRNMALMYHRTWCMLLSRTDNPSVSTHATLIAASSSIRLSTSVY